MRRARAAIHPGRGSGVGVVARDENRRSRSQDLPPRRVQHPLFTPFIQPFRIPFEQPHTGMAGRVTWQIELVKGHAALVDEIEIPRQNQAALSVL